MAHLRGDQVNAHSQSSMEKAVVDSDENNYFISGIFLSSSPSDVRAWEFLNYFFIQLLLLEKDVGRKTNIFGGNLVFPKVTKQMIICCLDLFKGGTQ